MATQPGQELFMLLRLAENTRGGDLQRIAEEEMESAGYRLRSGGEANINGLDAFLGTYSGQVDDIGEVVARVAHIRHDRDVYVLGGLGPADAFLRVEGDVNASIRSFRPLSREEAERIFPNEIALYVARAGDTWQSIAQRDGEEIVTARTLAIMNGSPVNEQPQTGDRLKVVEPGGR